MIEGEIITMGKHDGKVRLIIDVTVPKVPISPDAEDYRTPDEYDSACRKWKVSRDFAELQQREIALFRLGSVQIRQLEPDEVV